MRVLHFIKSSLPKSIGGIEQVVHHIARGTTRLGVKVDVLSLTRDQMAPYTIEVDGYRLNQERISMDIASTSFSISGFHRFKQLAKNADIIHYHFPWPFMDVVHFLTNIKKPTVVTYHSDIVRQKNLLKIYKPLMLRFLESVDCIVATSPNYLATSNILERYYKKTRVIPIGLDKVAYPSPNIERLRLWREKFGLKFFLFIGVMRYYKGLNFLIEAVRGTDYPLVIVGSGSFEFKLKEHVTKLGLKNIYFLGYLSDDDKVALLKLCYCVVLPSHLRSEAFGISLLEGAMYGRPMISCEIGTGTSFINIADETGLVVPPGDYLALRQAMRYIWENPTMALEMGRRAEERYWKYFRADQMVKSYVSLYGDIINFCTH